MDGATGPAVRDERKMGRRTDCDEEEADGGMPSGGLKLERGDKTEHGSSPRRGWGKKRKRNELRGGPVNYSPPESRWRWRE